ncbi:MAG: AbrB family transcriptional regulator [Thermotogae bacterium]|nr:MAG: AbrB family transcriptional regulator [Thermotogota bacterium]
MEESLEFHGSTTVGERGQISLPVSIRRKYNIKAGDKLLIFTNGKENLWCVLLLKGETLSKLLVKFEKSIKDILGKV